MIQHRQGAVYSVHSRNFKTMYFDSMSIFCVSSLLSLFLMAEQRAPAIYIPLMLGLGHGFPLWFPDLDSNLPAAYRASGTRVGDLGYITDDGGFAYLFNVCAPADDAINIGRVPPNFKPLAIPDHDSPDRVWQGAYPRRSALTTSHVRQTAISLEASAQGS